MDMCQDVYGFWWGFLNLFLLFIDFERENLQEDVLINWATIQGSSRMLWIEHNNWFSNLVALKIRAQDVIGPTSLIASWLF